MNAVLRLSWWMARGHPGRLILLVACIAIGVAARVGVGAFLGSVDRSLAAQARPLLGADIEIAGNAVFSPEQRADIAAALPPGARSLDQWTFTSMAAVDGAGTGPVEVHAVAPGHPLCGSLVAVDAAGGPVDGNVLFGEAPAILVQREFLGRFDAHVGDHVHLGKTTFVIAGIAAEDPGMGTNPFTPGPRVLMPLAALPATGLAGIGARVRHAVMVATTDPLQADGIARDLRKKWDLPEEAPAGFGGRAGSPSGLDVRTARQAQQSLAAIFDRVGDWLRVVALIALALGGVGVAALVRGMVGERLDEVATLSVLGASPGRVMAVFLIQALALGAIGGVIGAALGCSAQALLIGLLPAAIPITGAHLIDVGAVLWGVTLAITVAGFAAILPLLGIRAFSPLAVLRGEAAAGAPRLPFSGWVMAVAMLGLAVVVAALETHSWSIGPRVVGGLAVGGVLTAVVGGFVLRLLSRVRLLRGRLGFALRHGFANLDRANFRPGSALVAISLSALLFGVLAVHQHSLQAELDPSHNALPSLFAIDVQADQGDDLRAIVREVGGDPAAVELAPVVHARYRGRDGEVAAASATAAATTREGEREHFYRDREQNLSFRDKLGPDETIVAGRWIDDHATDDEASLEEGFAQRLGLHLGDRIRFDVQGTAITATITSLRRVRWLGIHPNFFILLSPHALVKAPATWVAALPPMDAPARLKVQRLIGERLPNVTAFDIATVGAQINNVIGRVILAVRAIGLFCLGAGLAVVVGIALSSARGRRADAALLKILGADNGVIALSIFAEFAAIGVVATVLGLGESLALAQVLLAGPLDLALAVPWLQLAVLSVGVTTLCAVVGVLACRPVFTQQPLAVLREE